MPRPLSNKINERGFTLIEMLIAITMSIGVLYLAFAALRVAGQTISVSKRLSVENGMMRTGIYAALEELDFWDQYDNRNSPNPAANPLRTIGKPFCPILYDPTKKENDPKTWWRGFGFSSNAANTLTWGNYAHLSKNSHNDPVRAWYPDQIKNINTTLGGYGMISYLPGDAIFSWYMGSGQNSLTMTGTPRDVWERTANTPTTANGLTYDKGEVSDLLPERPEHWPGLAVEARRYVVWSSFIDLCQVKMTSPISGETMHLAFWGVGTSLRGARQQRKLDTVEIK
jgi:type II secretory pathway pseudopilin PulG